MGLREVNAARTRDLILDTAIALFLEQGYDATRMDEVAERAGIGTSTLYRYFPTKDLLVLEPLALRGQMAETLASRPVEEPLAVALTHAVLALLFVPRDHNGRVRRVNTVIESTPALRSRLLEEFGKERRLLGQAVAERLGRPADDLYCVMTARMTGLVLELVAERAGLVSDDPALAEEQIRATTAEVLDRLQAEPPTLPQFPAATPS